MKRGFAKIACIILAGLCAPAFAQDTHPDAASLPDPFEMPHYQWAKTFGGNSWGSTSAIKYGPHNQVWAIDRCGLLTCENSTIAPVAELDMTTGHTIRAIGAGLFVRPHGLALDKQGNVYVADEAVSKDGTRGAQVIKLSPEGKVLMRLGTAGKEGGGPDHFNQLSDIVIAPNGDIFVSDGHYGQQPNTPSSFITRIIKFSPAGKFIKAWGSEGSGPSQFKAPHAMAFDSKGRLFVADRGNNRLQIFSQDGKLLDTYTGFGTPVGLYIDSKDTLYVTDADSTPQNHPGGWPKGIWIGSAKTGKVTGFVPDPNAGEGVLVGPNGNLYAAVNVLPHGITEYPLPYTPASK